MAPYNVFLPGYLAMEVNENTIQTGGLTARPVQGTLFQGVNAATAPLALTAVQTVTGAQEQQLSHIWLVSNDNTA